MATHWWTFWQWIFAGQCKCEARKRLIKLLPDCNKLAYHGRFLWFHTGSFCYCKSCLRCRINCSDWVWLRLPFCYFTLLLWLKFCVILDFLFWFFGDFFLIFAKGDWSCFFRKFWKIFFLCCVCPSLTSFAESIVLRLDGVW